MGKRIGLIARADLCGLGIESEEFARHIDCAKTLVIRGEHCHRPERFKNAILTDSIPTDSELDQFLNGLDVVFTFETPYNWNLFTKCKERGIKSILRANYEFNLNQIDENRPKPDLFVFPSLWNYEKCKFENKVYIHGPVDRQRCKFKKRTKINEFYHIAGHSLHEDRNGTEVLLQALKYTKNTIPFKIYTQHKIETDLNNVQIIHKDVDNYWDIHTGDCLILPRRFGGQSLQMNEALSCGIPVIMPRISPQNEFLPQEMMFDTSWKKPIGVQGGVIDWYDIDPQILAIKLDEMSNMDISSLSEWSNTYAETISWDTIKTQLMKVLNED